MTKWIAHWAAQNPRIRRVWVAPGHHVTVELEPVGDSDETAAIWMAKGPAWQKQLRTQLSPDADLEWFDPSARGVDGAGKVLVYERAA
jgi:hypothetical protein